MHQSIEPSKRFFSSKYVCIQVCVLFSLSGIQLWAYGKAIHEEFTENWRYPIVNCYGEHRMKKWDTMPAEELYRAQIQIPHLYKF